MRGFRCIVLAGVAFAAFSTAALPVRAAGVEWDHNNSIMKFVENGKKRRFIYEKPRKTLKVAGVSTGTILFDGEEKQDGRLSGYAKLFRKGCEPIDYFVEGTYDKAKGKIVLQGQAPIYSGKGCKITGYSENSGASRLLFTRLGGGDDLVAAVPEKEKRRGYLPPASISEESDEKEREQTARIERDDSGSRKKRQPPRQRSASRAEEDPLGGEEFIETEEFEDREERSAYTYRQRRAEREGRYDEEDAAYFAEQEEEEAEEDDFGYYEDDYEYDDDPAYYPRWRRY